MLLSGFNLSEFKPFYLFLDIQNSKLWILYTSFRELEYNFSSSDAVTQFPYISRMQRTNHLLRYFHPDQEGTMDPLTGKIGYASALSVPNC